MLLPDLVRSLEITLPCKVEVVSFQKDGWSKPYSAAPASRMKRPWVAVVNEMTLMDDRCRDLRYSTEAKAIQAGRRYAEEILIELK